MALPDVEEMIPSILSFGAQSDINGDELRQRLPEIMSIAQEDLTILTSRGAFTRFEINLRWALVAAQQRGYLKKLGVRRYHVTDAGKAWLAECDRRSGGVSDQVASNPPPTGTWFNRAYHANYRSEKEVEIRFVVPLLDHLGYEEDDRADGRWMEMNIGSRVSKVQTDFVCYDGPNYSPVSCLLLVETKFGSASLDKALNQARSYAHVLKPLWLLLTNGEVTEVWHRSETAQDAKVFACNRKGLYDQFDNLRAVAGKSLLAAEKKAKH